MAGHVPHTLTGGGGFIRGGGKKQTLAYWKAVQADAAKQLKAQKKFDKGVLKAMGKTIKAPKAPK